MHLTQRRTRERSGSYRTSVRHANLIVIDANGGGAVVARAPVGGERVENVVGRVRVLRLHERIALDNVVDARGANGGTLGGPERRVVLKVEATVLAKQKRW